MDDMTDDPCAEGGDDASAPRSTPAGPASRSVDEVLELSTKTPAASGRGSQRARNGLAARFADPKVIFAPGAQAVERLLRTAPAFIEAIRAARPVSILVADVPEHVSELVDAGILHFSRDSNGALLATLRNSKGHFEHSIRLNELDLTPELGNAIVDLQQQLTMGQILSEMREVQQAIDSIHVGLVEDRLAIADSAWDQGQQAMRLSDPSVRMAKLIAAQSRATDARAIHTRHIAAIKTQFDTRGGQNALERAKDSFMHTRSAERSAELFALLSGAMKSLQVEVNIYLMLGETEAAQTCIAQFADFLEVNGLDDEDALLELHSYGETGQEQLITALLTMSASMGAIAAAADDGRPHLEYDPTEEHDGT